MGLTGNKLLDYLRGVPSGTPEPDIIRGAGYVFSRGVKGQEQDVILRNQFWLAVAEAKGGELACLVPLKGASDLKISDSGRVVLQAPHIRFLGGNPGDMVRVSRHQQGQTNYLLVYKAQNGAGNAAPVQS